MRCWPRPGSALIHSIVFAGFSPEALASRVKDGDATLIVTADEAPRGGRNTPLKTNVDKARDDLRRRAGAGGRAHRRRRPDEGRASTTATRRCSRKPPTTAPPRR